MQLFLDTANIKEIREAKAIGILDGITTNPSLVAKEGRDFREVIREICDVVDGPVSAEVTATTAEAMLREGRQLAKLHRHVVVKIPMIPEGLKAVRQLTGEGIKVNVTLIFSPVQALLAAKAGATYVSPFIGRLDDIGHEGMDVVRQILEIFRRYAFATKVLVASIRHPQHVVDAARLGADVATMPYAIFMQLFQHPLTESGLKRFLADWEKLPKGFKDLA